MANPNPFLFGDPPAAEMANPFMDASQGMAEVNPFMMQQQMMGQAGYASYNQYGQQAHVPQPEQANPFGDYSSMGYEATNVNSMYYGSQQQNPYYNDQFASMPHMTTDTSTVPSNTNQHYSLGNAAGAALFGVEPTGSSAMSIASSTPEANPFLTIAESPASIAPVASTEGVDTPTAINPFADHVESEVEEPEVGVELNENQLVDTETFPDPPSELLLTERPQTLVTEMVGGLEVSTSDMLQKLEIAKTPVAPGLEVKQIEDSDSDEEVEEIEKPTADLNIGDTPEINIEESKEEVNIIEEKESTGFSGIFGNELNDTGETIQTATSHVDLYSETADSKEEVNVQEEDKEEPALAESKEEKEEEVVEEVKPVYQTGGTAAGLFDDLPVNGYAPGISTGDALFSDMPSVPDIKSTGAAIFGLSDESAAGSTGAALFDIVAPEPSKPCHGEMSGWDENFDKMFEKAEMQAVAAPADAFGGGFGQGAAAFGYAAPPTFGEDPAFGDSFGMLPVSADMNNPFLAEQSGMPGPGDKNGDEVESPLFDSDVSKPLEPFPRLHSDTDVWEMYIRHPPKKKITAQRFWKKVFVRIVNQGENPAILLFDAKDSKDPFQELPLQAAYSLSDISHQVFDQYSKVFTIKLQYIFYKERAGIRPGQVSKMQKLTDKIGFLAKAVEDADYQGVKEFASDMKKLGVPLEHAPQISELLKLASISYEDMKQFSVCIEERLFKIDVHRDRALTYKTEEVQMTAVDEVYVEQNSEGHITKHLCRVRVFFLSFLSGMPEVDVGVNDMTRMGLEVVGRHDILPVPTEQWIRYEDIEFHNVVNTKAFEAEDHIIKFQPPDGCYIEVMRFRTRPPRSRELPMKARCDFIINGNKVEIRADIMVPYHATKAWGQVPCEDVAMRIPLPECWIYQFRTEKHNLSLSQVFLEFGFRCLKGHSIQRLQCLIHNSSLKSFV